MNEAPTPQTSSHPLKQATLFARAKIALRGLWFGFAWVHCGGESSYTSAMLASFHHPFSITWRWAIYWQKPRVHSWKLSYSKWNSPSPGNGSRTITLPLIGGLSLSWQEHLWL